MGEYGRTFTSRPVGTVISTHTSGELLLSTRRAVVPGSIDDTSNPGVCEIKNDLCQEDSWCDLPHTDPRIPRRPTGNSPMTPCQEDPWCDLPQTDPERIPRRRPVGAAR